MKVKNLQFFVLVVFSILILSNCANNVKNTKVYETTVKEVTINETSIKEDAINETSIKEDAINETSITDKSSSLECGQVEGVDNCQKYLNKKYSEFLNLVDTIHKEKYKPFYLSNNNDFLDMGIGVLVHKECLSYFDELKSNPKNIGNQDVQNINIKDIVVGSFDKGLQCMEDLNDYGTEYFGAKENKVFTSHIPKLVNLLTNQNNKIKIFCGEDENIKKMKEYCKYKNDKSKIESELCYGLEFSPALAVGDDRNEQNYIIEYNGEMKVYDMEGSIVFFEKSKKASIGEFQSMLWHELFHILGHIHNSRKENDFATYCEFACFPEVHRYKFTGTAEEIEERIEEELDNAKFMCSDPEYDTDSNSIAGSLRRILTKGY